MPVDLAKSGGSFDPTYHFCSTAVAITSKAILIRIVTGAESKSVSKVVKRAQDGAQGHSTMPTDASDHANVIALPPLIVGATLGLGLVLHFVRPIGFLARKNALLLGVLLIVVSIPVAIAAARQFAKAKTAFDVRNPTTEIVTGGVFGISRNPTYLSMMLGFLGIASLVDSLWLLVLALPLTVILQKGVIEPEERYLEQKFGEKYLRYKAQVRRWI
jgi:protein-S-isoprenylcysteine O-methyltransferase Ste14